MNLATRLQVGMEAGYDVCGNFDIIIRSVTQLVIKARYHLPPKLHRRRDNHTQRPCPLCPLQRRLPPDRKLRDVDQRLDRPGVGQQDGANAVAHCDERSTAGVREDGERMQGVVGEEEHGDVGPVAGPADDVPFLAFVGYLSGVDHGGGRMYEIYVCTPFCQGCGDFQFKGRHDINTPLYSCSFLFPRAVPFFSSSNTHTHAGPMAHKVTRCNVTNVAQHRGLSTAGLLIRVAPCVVVPLDECHFSSVACLVLRDT